MSGNDETNETNETNETTPINGELLERLSDLARRAHTAVGYAPQSTLDMTTVAGEICGNRATIKIKDTDAHVFTFDWDACKYTGIDDGACRVEWWLNTSLLGPDYESAFAAGLIISGERDVLKGEQCSVTAGAIKRKISIRPNARDYATTLIDDLQMEFSNQGATPQALTSYLLRFIERGREALARNPQFIEESETAALNAASHREQKHFDAINRQERKVTLGRAPLFGDVDERF